MTARPRRPDPVRLVLTLLAAAISLLFLLPILWLPASSLRPSAETFATSSPLGLRAVWPQAWTPAPGDVEPHFTAPKVSPRTRLRWNRNRIRSTGARRSTALAEREPQSTCW